MYDALGALFPEVAWGIFAIVIGFFMALGVNRQSYWSLTRGAMAGFFHWFIISIFYFLGDWQSTAGITGLMLAIYCAFIYVNIRVNRHTILFKEYNELRNGK